MFQLFFPKVIYSIFKKNDFIFVDKMRIQKIENILLRARRQVKEIDSETMKSKLSNVESKMSN